MQIVHKKQVIITSQFKEVEDLWIRHSGSYFMRAPTCDTSDMYSRSNRIEQ